MTRIASTLLFALAWLSFGCTTHYDVAEQQVRLRLTADAKALLVLEVERGISATPKQASAALHALERALQGGKCFPAEEGFFSIDFDRTDFEKFTDEELAAFRELASNVTIEEAHVFRDDRKTLCFARLTRVDNLERSLGIVNDWLNRVFSANHDKDKSFEPYFPIYDEDTFNAVGRATRNDHAWFSIRDGALVLDTPMSETNAARCVAAIADKVVEDWMIELLRQMSSLRVADGHALVRFCEPNRPILRFDSKPSAHQIDETLLNALREKGVLIRGPDEFDRMVKRFETPPKVVEETK